MVCGCCWRRMSGPWPGLSRCCCEKTTMRWTRFTTGRRRWPIWGPATMTGHILDIMMPKRDRIDVLCQLRRQGNRLPVLLLTAKSEVDDKVLGLDSGANDYLTKPFASQELLARIRAMTREQTQ
ncbi:MAG: response regulator [Evtepia gabavorous]